MKGGEIYDSIVTRCLEIKLNTSRLSEISELLHSAVLCMAETPAITDHDIYRKYFERAEVRLGIVEERRQPAPTSKVEECNVRDGFLEPLSFYLPKDTEIQNAHIEAYENLTTIVPELWAMYELKSGSSELTAITTYLMGDIVESVRQLHAKHKKP
jgi:hypothetical protein